MPFPKDFYWGAATASYQIEGAAQTDGRGECIWTRFSHTPDKVHNGDTGDVACDHYHRYPEDVKLMQALGIKAYRFSTSWARVLPNGTGAPNPAGLDFYDRLVDALLAANITPFVTLYHWDLPQALQDRGEGWENPDSVGWFTDYARLMGERLGDRVQHWITHNEPWVVAFVGNHMGEQAPGKTDLQTALKVAHHLLISHGSATTALREVIPNAQIGIAPNYSYIEPLTDSPEDQEAIRIHDGERNRWFIDPIFFGKYPADVVADYQNRYGNVLDGIDLDAIAAAQVPIDFLGVNYYSRDVKEWTGEGAEPFRSVKQADSEYTEMGWEVYPPGIRKMLLRLQADYNPPAIYITENGCAFNDPEPVNGVVDDPRRVAYLEGHFKEAEAAIEQGAKLKGYFVWSLMDNFEWAWGYGKRFGLIHINYDTLERTPKQSYYFYQQFIEGTHA